MLDLSQFRGYRAADALTRAAPVGRTEFASLTVLFPCSNFVSGLEPAPCGLFLFVRERTSFFK